MLDALRRGATGWLAKILLSVLVLSFAIWGIADVFTGFGRGSLAKVGSTEITAERFQRQFQNQLAQLSDRAGERVTTEMALALGLDRQVLDRMVGQSALLAKAHEMKLALSDEALVEGLRNDPAFHGPDGKFSRVGFEGFLRQIGLSEQGFLAVRREDELRRQLADAIAAATVTPKALVAIKQAWSDETRTVQHFNIDAVRVISVADPDDAKISETYEQNKREFMAPELRKLAVLLLTIDELKKEVTLTDDDLKKAFEDDKDTYDKPEQRRIQQIAFKDKAAAEEARKALVEGKKNFMDVAKELGAKESDVNLGMLAKKQVIDPAIADAAFKLARDAISDVIEGRFATVLVRVIEIAEGKTSSFDEVKDQVRDKLTTKKAEAMVHDRVDIVEEARNAGKTLKEIAELHKLMFVDIPSTTADNKTPDDKTAFDNPDAATVLRAAFAASAGVQTDVVELTGGAYAWYDVLEVTAARQKTLEEAKDAVKTFYLDTERDKKLKELATSLADRAGKGEDMEKLATEAGNGKVETSESIKRVMSVPGLSTDAVKQIFSLAKGAAGHAGSSDKKTRVVFKLTDIIAASAPTADDEAKTVKDLSEQLKNDQLLVYLDAIKGKLGVTVNEKELRRLTGADAQQQ